MISRIYYNFLIKYHFPHKKLLLLVGPRQVGKTTLSKMFLSKFKSEKLYYNWDNINIRKKIVKNPYFFLEDIEKFKIATPVIVFDEIHKFPDWKNYLKGIFDSFGEDITFIITGSARLDIYKKGADSLIGRYFLYKLFPLTIGELLKNFNLDNIETIFTDFEYSERNETVHQSLFSTNGFPEPYLKQRDNFLLRWAQNRKKIIFNEDIRDLTNIRNISLIEMLVELIPERIGSILSINSIREDVNVSFNTLKNWLNVLERLYYIFSITPYAKRITRSIIKENKIYLWDWSEIEEESIKFENYVAAHLKKFIEFFNDFGIDTLQLHFLRDKEKREVDFLICRKNKPLYLIEVKNNDITPSKNLIYFMNKLNLKKGFQIVNKPDVYEVKKTGSGFIYILSASSFLSNLP